MKSTLSFLLLLLPCLAFAQRFQGKITNQQSKPLAYVNIGIVGKDVGTVSTEKGSFALTLPTQLDGELLQVSAIGYRPWQVQVGEFKQKFQQQEAVIQLIESPTQLSEVKVRPKQFVTKVIGNTTTSKSTTVGFTSNDLGSEIGVHLKIKKPSFLEKVTFNIASNGYDTLFLRINLYRMGKNGPEENLLPQPLYLNVAKQDITDGITLDVHQHNIYVDADVLLTLELVRHLSGQGLWFSGGLLNNATYARETSQGEWEKLPLVGVGFNATISQEK